MLCYAMRDTFVHMSGQWSPSWYSCVHDSGQWSPFRNKSGPQRGPIVFFFVENGPNPYNKSNQLKMKIATFLESDFYCPKKRKKKNADSTPPLFPKQNKSDSGLGNENQWKYMLYAMLCDDMLFDAMLCYAMRCEIYSCTWAVSDRRLSGQWSPSWYSCVHESGQWSPFRNKSGPQPGRICFFVENGPNPYTKSNQLKMKIATFLESEFYCLVNLFQMFKKAQKKNMPIVPPFFLSNTRVTVA